MKMKFAAAASLILCMLMATSKTSSAKNDVEEIMNRVEKTLDNLKTLYCSFERSYYSKVSDRTSKISGKIYLKEPNLLRIEYPAQTIVVDGEKTWVYVPKNNQVQISNFIEGDETFPTPHSIFEKYSKERKIEFLGNKEFEGKEHEVLNLIPPSNNENYLHVFIDTEIYFPVKTIIESSNGDTNTYVLRDIALNRIIENDVFTFVAPEGVETIDLRE